MIESRVPRRRGTRRLTSALAGAAAAALVLTGCGGEQAGPSGGGSNIVQGTGVVTEVPAGERQPAPELTGEGTHDEELALSDYRGQVVVLNVWGSWCAPCIAEAPHLAKVAADTADQDVQFLGINTRDRQKINAQKFDERHGIDYPSFFDPTGRLILEFPRGTLSPQAIPTTLILDREGNIAVRALKALTEDELRRALDPVLAEG
ncbi:TlpA disulfide reductase family protein [Streptomyces sp. ACA25]|uniref:TlpA family protein disulfide reductase n=1 Tax=Streptomyces sp. ACA25 TaxID=3022596 RepID=UPI002306FCBC|nr:TlpA disulfide reductase family protein [Streptomyces sp. ACA25]MDB1087900.1 TlpA disulfide reductase family protein [Streptomyces sp. ACA25]